MKQCCSFSVSYFQEAIDWLLSQDYVLPGGVGTVGVSTGGELALLLASYFPDKVSQALKKKSKKLERWPNFRKVKENFISCVCNSLHNGILFVFHFH